MSPSGTPSPLSAGAVQVDVRVPAGADHDVVRRPALVVEVGEHGDDAVGPDAEHLGSVEGADEEGAVGHPAEARGVLGPDCDLEVAVLVDGHDRARGAVGEPQAILVPARSLAVGEPVDEQLGSQGLGHVVVASRSAHARCRVSDMPAGSKTPGEPARRASTPFGGMPSAVRTSSSGRAASSW